MGIEKLSLEIKPYNSAKGDPNQPVDTNGITKRRATFTTFSQSILSDFKSGNKITLTASSIDEHPDLNGNNELKIILKMKLADFEIKVPLRNKVNSLLKKIEAFKNKRHGTNKEITMIIDTLITALKAVMQKLSEENTELTTLTTLNQQFKNIVDAAAHENKMLLNNHTENGKPGFFTLQSTATDLATLDNLLALPTEAPNMDFSIQ
ncbi:MAG: hypothetical protein Q8L78_08125 [Coxiellaceae bacterium]|nr:hypothetical protein [Coxiellaceae bacterium]